MLMLLHCRCAGYWDLLLQEGVELSSWTRSKVTVTTKMVVSTFEDIRLEPSGSEMANSANLAIYLCNFSLC